MGAARLFLALVVASNHWNFQVLVPRQRPWSDHLVLGFNAGPPMTPGAYNNHVQIVQASGYVVLVTEMVHNARSVPIDGRPHLSARLRQYSGD